VAIDTSTTRLDQNDRDRFALQKDGLHDIVVSPELQDALFKAVAAYLGPLFEPDLIESIRRYVVPGDRNDSRSYAVGTEPPAAGRPGRTRILEHDPSRTRAFVFNAGAQTVFVGGRQVTTGALNDPNGGIPILTNTGMWFEDNVGELFAISGTTDMDVRVLDVAGGV
jgi:hypothetical protein